MLYKAEFSVCSQINTQHTNAVWAERWMLNVLLRHLTIRLKRLTYLWNRGVSTIK